MLFGDNTISHEKPLIPDSFSDSIKVITTSETSYSGDLSEEDMCIIVRKINYYPLCV